MTLPVLLLVIGMRGPPLPLTIARDLRVLWVRAQLLTVIVGPAPALIIHCAANALSGDTSRVEKIAGNTGSNETASGDLLRGLENDLLWRPEMIYQKRFRN